MEKNAHATGLQDGASGGMGLAAENPATTDHVAGNAVEFSHRR